MTTRHACAILLAAFALLAAGCGGDDKESGGDVVPSTGTNGQTTPTTVPSGPATPSTSTPAPATP